MNKKRNLSIGVKIAGWEYVTDRCVDKKGVDLLGLNPLPYEDNTITNAYISNMLEFLTDEAIDNLISEIKRVTIRGGKIRICCLNSMLLYYSARNNDREMFFDLMSKYPFPKQQVFNKEVSTEQLWIFSFASQLSGVMKGTYKDEDVKEKFDTLGINKFWNELKSEVDMEKHIKNPMFINALTIADMHELLAKHDLKFVHISGYGQSPLPEVRNTKIFDNSFPQASFYLEIMR